MKMDHFTCAKILFLLSFVLHGVLGESRSISGESHQGGEIEMRECYYHSDCQNETEIAEKEYLLNLYSNKTANETIKLPLYECCFANDSTSTDSSSENEPVFSPGACCAPTPTPLWVVILIGIGLFVCCVAVCVVCCIVRPRLEALCEKFQPPRLTGNNLQTMAAIKTLTTDPPIGNQMQSPFQSGPNQPIGVAAPPPGSYYQPTQPLPPQYQTQYTAQYTPQYSPAPNNQYAAQPPQLGYPQPETTTAPYNYNQPPYGDFKTSTA